MTEAAKFSTANLPEPTRGFIVVGGELEEVPSYLLTHETLLWPPGMPEKLPGEPVKYFKPDDLYRRVHLVDEGVYLFVRDRRDADSFVEDARKQVRQALGLK